MGSFATSLVGVACLLIGLASGSKTVYNVVDFGAVGDGKSDDTKHFMAAWSAACSHSGPSKLLVPGDKTFLLGQVFFSGPCKYNMHVQVIGTIVAPSEAYMVKSNNKWITFYQIENLTMDGGGQFDGRGFSWWKCKADKKCSNIPDGLNVMHCNNIRMYSLTIMNAPAKQVTIYGSNGVFISNLHIISPGNSINTDGMHIQECKQAIIKDSTISSGDDCIGIGTGTSGLNITRISCGPGHGISIGSLGMFGKRDTVTDVHVSHCDFYQTMYAARIKTWSGGTGLVQGITFQHINLSSVEYPIMIDQYYCPEHNCQNHTAAVKVVDVRFVGIRGTTTGESGIQLTCSDLLGCTGILMKNVNITSSTPGKKLESLCSNAHGDAEGEINPEVPCLS